MSRHGLFRNTGVHFQIQRCVLACPVHFRGQQFFALKTALQHFYVLLEPTMHFEI